MTTIRLTREFSFEMAHALAGYDGACSRVHGHSYRLFVTVRGVPSTDPQDPKEGMVLDFTILKEIVNNLIINKLDHKFLVREVVGTNGACAVGMADTCDNPHPTSDTGAGDSGGFANEVRLMGGTVVDFQPTCENLVAWMAGVLSPALPQGVELFSLKLHETARSFAEWFAEDN